MALHHAPASCCRPLLSPCLDVSANHRPLLAVPPFPTKTRQSAALLICVSRFFGGPVMQSEQSWVAGLLSPQRPRPMIDMCQRGVFIGEPPANCQLSGGGAFTPIASRKTISSGSIIIAWPFLPLSTGHVRYPLTKTHRSKAAAVFARLACGLPIDRIWMRPRTGDSAAEPRAQGAQTTRSQPHQVRQDQVHDLARGSI